MSFFPTSLEIEDRSLVIQWSDGNSQSIQIRELRNQCPCAHCRDERSKESPQSQSSLNILSPGQAQPLTITKMEPVGNYAYSIQYSDGHSSGIYPFEFLRSLND